MNNVVSSKNEKMEQIDIMTNLFRTKIVKVLKSKGFKYESSKTSALSEWSFTKSDEPVIAIIGYWKGKYGLPYAVIHEVITMEKVLNFNTIFKIDLDTVNDPEKLDLNEYQIFLDNIINWVNQK